MAVRCLTTLSMRESDGLMPRKRVKVTQALLALAVEQGRDGLTEAATEAELNFEFQFSSKRVQIWD